MKTASASDEIQEQIARLDEAWAVATTSAQRRKLAALYEEVAWERCKGDPWFFCRTFAITRDEHAEARGEEPYRHFPDKDYLRIFVEEWWKADPPWFLIPKSRQMIASWLTVTLHLWLAMTKRAQLIYFQSKKEEDAAALVQRTAGVYERLSPMIRSANPMVEHYGKIDFKATDSQILGIPQGAHQIRMHTPSALFSDEMAFQDEAEEAYVAAQACLEGGGRYTGVSSAAPGFFEQMVEMDRA